VLLPGAAQALAVALGIGLMIGLERERRKGDGPTREAAGLRTFTLVSLLGALCAVTAVPWLVPIGALGVAVLAAMAYRRTSDSDPGLTTEIALLVTFGLGALAAFDRTLAAGSGVLVALLLGLREPLHAFATNRLSEREWRDAVLLAAAALVVLPLLPDRTIDPWGAINPQLVWRLTVVVLLVNAAGYVSLRVLGHRWGLPLAGLLGGFVSSAAVVAAMGRRTKAQPTLMAGAVAGAVWSSVATGLQLAIVLSAINARLLAQFAVPLGAFVGVAVVFGWLAGRHAWRTPQDGTAPAGRAFDPASAALITLLFAAMLVAVAIANRAFGSNGAIVAALLGAFLDTHAAAASLAGLAANQSLAVPSALVGICAALTANTITKLVLAAATGGARYFARVAPGLIAMVLALWGALGVMR
jgi:uncharacterized membrane protein (DUF4010 family)